MREPRNPPPLYGTPRNPSRKTLGPAVCKVMTAFGNPPMPWQRDALAVACEIDPETGGYYYDTVIIVVLRRAGKTTMSRGKVTHRALTTPDAQMVYTAQNRIKALARLRKDFYTPLLRSPFAPTLGRPRWRGGEEAVLWKNGAELMIDAVGRKSGHGETLTEGHIDEAYAHVDSTLEGGLAPTMMTVIGSQLWILSAAGDSESHYLRGKVELGRAMIESGVQSRTCYIEYSAPRDADPEDIETLLNAHPAVGHTLDADRIMSARVGLTEESLAEWERAWLGWWPQAKQPPAVIPADAWRACYAPDDDPELWAGEPLWTVDVSPERDWTSIGLAARSTDPEARLYLELIQREEGTEWAVPRLRELAGKYGGWNVALDVGGGAGSLVPDLEDAGFEVVKMPAAQRAAACTGFFDDAMATKLRTVPHASVTAARIAAIKHRVGETWTFNRGKSLEDITALYALVVARWAWIERRESDYDIGDSVF